MRKMVAIDKDTWDKIVELSDLHHGLPLGKVVTMVIEFYFRYSTIYTATLTASDVTYPTERQE